MDKITKITLKTNESNKTIGESFLNFKLSGDNIDYIVTNTIRRIILSDIPIYAFNNFKFEKNTSVLHNDYIKLRLMHIPIWDINNTVEYLDPDHRKVEEIFKNDDNENNEEDGDINDTENSKPKDQSKSTQMTMYVNHSNNMNEIVSVTTDDAKFYYNEKQIDSPFKTPVPLAKLQPKQEIAFSAITDIGTENENSMYSAVCVAAYKENNMNDFDFSIESRGQLTEKRILQVSLINIDRKLKNFMKQIKDSDIDENVEDFSGTIVVNNEDHTLGNLIARGMQKHKKINFAGYNLPHPRVAKVVFHYKHEKGTNIIKIIEDVVEYYTEIFDEIKKIVDKLP